MIKLSKESKITFFSLLLIPVIWICLNHFGYLDYLKVKSVDLRKQFRGEIPQDITAQSEDRILVEMNQTLKSQRSLMSILMLQRWMEWERSWIELFRDTMTLLEKEEHDLLLSTPRFTPAWGPEWYL